MAISTFLWMELFSRWGTSESSAIRAPPLLWCESFQWGYSKRKKGSGAQLICDLLGEHHPPEIPEYHVVCQSQHPPMNLLRVLVPEHQPLF